jgi:serine/threonine-protein kinase HipA
MCFNAIARNHDDHTKNISFLMDPQGEWHLSPAYDVTFAYNPGNIWLKQHQMSINGKRLGITREPIY